MLTSLQWDDEYSVEIPEIDEQHKVLFSLVDRLGAAIREKRGSAACQGILNELVEYTKVHFALEESLMRLGKYPGFEIHKQQHEDLLREVSALQEKVAAGSTAISFELMQFLRVWLTKHILQSDQKYSIYFHKTGFVDFEGHPADGRSRATKKRPWWKFW